MHSVVFRCDCLDAKVIRAKAVLRLFKGVELAVGGCEARVMTEVGKADTLSA